MKPIGFLVMEFCEDYEQALCLVTSQTLPLGGILSWADSKLHRTLFESRDDAKAAITRTDHYRLAYGRNDLPEKKLCKVVPVVAAQKEQP